MKNINELTTITPLGSKPKIKGTPITTDSTPKMDLEIKTDIGRQEHTNANPNYSQELAPEGIPQDAWNTMRDEHFAPKPESEWSDKPNKYVQKIIDLKNKGIHAIKHFAGDVKDKFLNWRGIGAPSIEDIKRLIKKEDKKYPQNWKAPEQPEWTGESMKNLNRMRTLAGLAGLNEREEDLPGKDVWAYSPKGEGGVVARVVRTEHGFQVYVQGPYGWIAQGQPHMSQEEAQDDAMSFFEAVAMVDFDKLNEEELNEVKSALELTEEQLTEEQTSEHTVVSVLHEEQLNEWLPAALGIAGVAAAGAAGWNWLKGTKKKVKDRKDTHQDKIDQALNDSIKPQPWWNDMETTLLEMKAEMLGASTITEREHTASWNPKVGLPFAFGAGGNTGENPAGGRLGAPGPVIPGDTESRWIHRDTESVEDIQADIDKLDAEWSGHLARTGPLSTYGGGMQSGDTDDAYGGVVPGKSTWAGWSATKPKGSAIRQAIDHMNALTLKTQQARRDADQAKIWATVPKITQADIDAEQAELNRDGAPERPAVYQGPLEPVPDRTDQQTPVVKPVVKPVVEPVAVEPKKPAGMNIAAITAGLEEGMSRKKARKIYVTNLQQQLVDLGYDPKGVDGLMGKNTRRAMAAYNKDHPDNPILIGAATYKGEDGKMHSMASKRDLKAAGIDNLRDFMNAGYGLTRREKGEKVSDKAKRSWTGASHQATTGPEGDSVATRLNRWSLQGATKAEKKSSLYKRWKSNEDKAAAFQKSRSTGRDE